MSFYTFARSVVYLVSKLLYKVQYQGLENIPEGGFILCSNHISQFDPIFVAVKVKPQCFFMAKEELFRFKPFGALIRALGAFPVARGKGDTGGIQRAVDLVRSGHVVAIFPEGHRSKTGELLKLKSGAVLIAAETGCGLLPCIIKKGKRKGIRRPVVVRYGNFVSHENLGIQNRLPSEIRFANRLLTASLTTLLEDTHA